MPNKKAQQEMVGLILIIILVVIGMVVALIININNSTKVEHSDLANNLLGSIQLVTTSCKVSYSYQNIKELSKSCHDNKNCLDGNYSCDILNNTLKEILENIMVLESQVSYLNLEIVHVGEDFEETQISLKNGNCTGSYYGSEPITSQLPHGDENLRAILYICLED